MSDPITPVPGTPQTATKAIVAGVISFIALVAQGLVPLLPDPTIQVWLQIILVIVGAAGAAFGVYQIPNKAKHSTDVR